jgi:triphosphoribosyl-dephospho-CoA synthase
VFPDSVAIAAQLACLLEASAAKPGNVSPGRPFHDTRYEDFLASAAAIGPAMALAGQRPIGPTVLAAVEATARWAPSNTNLGIILLFAPIARAAIESSLTAGGEAGPRAAGGISIAAGLRAGGISIAALRDGVDAVLAATTIADARAVYAAIRLARPGGLGHVDAQDVRDEPDATLQVVMTLAAGRDAIAREYATGFAATFDTGLPALSRARSDGLSWDSAVVETYLVLLAAAPDTLIARKLGVPEAQSVSRAAAAIVAAGGVRTPTGRSHLDAFDVRLRDPRNARNPGATADLTAATLFAYLLAGDYHLRPTVL